MNKKFLSAILFGAMMATSAGTFVSCKDYDDDIESLSDRISAVETLVKELQSQIQSGAVIKSVTKSANGIVITLSNGETFEVSNGADGKDGKAGSIVTIGENGNWFIDGVDTGKPSQGAKGDKGDKGDQGEQGPAGDKGETGGVAPVYYYPGIAGEEDGYWVKVTVGADGKETKEITSIKWASSTGTSAGVSAIWSNDALTLTNVRGAQGGVVTVALSGDMKALVFEVDMVLDGQNAMEYIWTPYNAITEGAPEEGEMTVHNYNGAEKTEPYKVGVTDVYAQEYTYLNPTQIKQYHMDPATSVVPSWWSANQTLDVVSRDVDFVKTSRALSNDAEANPSANYKFVKEGVMNVGVTMQGQLVMTQEEEDRYDLGIFARVEANDAKITDMAIQAPMDAAKENVITSTYASVYASQMAVEAIAYNLKSDYAKNYIINEQEHGCEVLVGDGCETPLEGGHHLYDLSTDAAEQAATVELAYNSVAGVNLHELVTTHVGYNSRLSWNNTAIQELTVAKLAEKGMKYRFEQVNFVVGGNGTEQSQNHSILETRENGTYIVACGVKSLSDTDPTMVEPDPSLKAKAYASIGRTPLIRVTLNDTINNKVVKVGYIKFKIVAPEEPIISEEFNLGAYYYSCDAKVKKIAWHAIEAKVLEAARQTSKETFDALYKIEKDANGNVVQYVPAENSVYGQPQFAPADYNDEEDLNGDGIAYEDVNSILSKVGIIKEIADNGAETTDVFKWTIEREDFVWAYEQFAESYPEITITRYVKYMVKDNLGNSNFNAEPVFLPITITFRYPTGIMANKIAKYWYAENSMNEDNAVLSQEEMKFLHANVEVPATVVEEHAAATEFIYDLDTRFELFNINHTAVNQPNGPDYTLVNENAPSIEVKKEANGYEWNTEANFADFVNEKLVYYYSFNLNNIKTVKGVDGLDYELTVGNTVENNPVMLYTDAPNYVFKNTELFANGTLIARIEHSTKSASAPTGKQYTARLIIENNEAAKAVLNLPKEWTKDVTAAVLLDQTLDVEIEVVAFNQCYEYLPLVNNTFGVEILKPVYAKANGPIEFTDAHDNGMDQTKVNLYDLVSFYDWRQWQFAEHLNYYNYYGVKEIYVNLEEIETDITGEMKPVGTVSKDVEFELWRGGVEVPTLKIGAVPGANATLADLQAHYGELRYVNNTGTVVSFNFRIPVRYTHYWSHESELVWVEGSVNRSENN